MSGERERENNENCNAECKDDDVSTASGLSSFFSPILGKQKDPTFDFLPPYILDAQLVTTKTEKECQRLILFRIFRMQDVARVRLRIGEEENEEEFDVIAPLSSPRFLATGEDAVGPKGTDVSGEEEKDEGKVDYLLESLQSLKSLQEAASLVQKIKSLGGTGFAIDHPQPMREGNSASGSHSSSTKSYLKSFGDAMTSPIRFFGGNNEEISSSHLPYPTVMELMTLHLMNNYTHSPSVGISSKSLLESAKRKSKGLFPALSNEDEPYVKSSWMLLRDCIEELDRRCLAYR
jgi:hypothetical protein